MDIFCFFVFEAVLTEAIWEILKNIIPKVSDDIWKYINIAGAVAVGVLIAILTDTNIFVLLGIPLKNNIIGNILTGILISRGSNYTHDLINKLKPAA